MKKVIFIAGLVALVVVAGLGTYLGGHNHKKITAHSTTSKTQKAAVSSQDLHKDLFGDKKFVVIDKTKLYPETITIPSATSLEWQNSDKTSYQLVFDTAQPGAPPSTNLGAFSNTSITFNTAGTYAYHFQDHPDIKGTVKVVK